MRRMAPPQSGQTHGASCTTSVRGRWSGSGCRYGLAVSRVRVTTGIAAVAASASRSSSPSSSWSAWCVSFSDERPKAMRRSRATCIRNCSSSAPAAMSMAFRRAISSGSEAASGDTPAYTRTPVPIHAKAAGNRTFYQAKVGCEDRIGCRQSTPSSSIDSCAGVSTATPSAVAGQVNRPRSRRLAWSTRP